MQSTNLSSSNTLLLGQTDFHVQPHLTPPLTDRVCPKSDMNENDSENHVATLMSTLFGGPPRWQGLHSHFDF